MKQEINPNVWSLIKNITDSFATGYHLQTETFLEEIELRAKLAEQKAITMGKAAELEAAAKAKIAAESKKK